MSHRPQGFAALAPTAAGCFGAARSLVLNTASAAASLSPTQYGMTVPARQAYSHSASVGSRYDRWCATSSGRWARRAQNCSASCQLTVSTGWFSPPLACFDGFFPVTAWYSACVTGNTDR